MKRNAGKIAAAVLCVLLLVLAAGCSMRRGSQASGGSRPFVPVPAGDWKTPYETTVNLTSVTSMGNDLVFEGGDSMSNSPWTRAWKEDLNIEVSWDWLEVGGTGYDQRINMAIASNTLPDVFGVNYRQFRQLLQADSILDITDVYRNNTSQRIRDYERTDPDTIKTASVNGRIYGVPGYYYGIIDAPKHLWVRKDWYEAAGSPVLRTVADLENLARGFMSRYGGYGINTSNTLEWLLFTGPMFGVYVGNVNNSEYFWYPDSTGRIKAGIAHPEFKTALTYWAKWYSEGILSADFPNLDDNRAHEDIINGRTGLQPWWQWQGWMNGPNLVAMQGDNGFMVPLRMPTVDGSPSIGQVGFPNGKVIVVNKNCQNPAAVMKILSYTDYIMFDPNTVLTDAQFRSFTDGQREHAMGNAFSIIDPAADMLQYEHVAYALRTGDTSQLFTAGMQKKYGDSIDWIQNRNPGGLGAFLQQGYETCAYYQAKQMLDNRQYISTSLWGPTPEEFDRTANTGDIISMGVSRIITGAEPVSYYDSVLAEWYAGGGQLLEDTVNSLYGR